VLASASIQRHGWLGRGDNQQAGVAVAGAMGRKRKDATRGPCINDRARRGLHACAGVLPGKRQDSNSQGRSAGSHSQPARAAACVCNDASGSVYFSE
jgi:hypothetical protein